MFSRSRTLGTVAIRLDHVFCLVSTELWLEPVEAVLREGFESVEMWFCKVRSRILQGYTDFYRAKLGDKERPHIPTKLAIAIDKVPGSLAPPLSVAGLQISFEVSAHAGVIGKAFSGPDQATDISLGCERGENLP